LKPSTDAVGSERQEMNMSDATYRNWRLNGFGLDHIKLAETAAPDLGDHDLLVRVGAVSLNHRDKLVVDGALASKLAFPYTPASDAAGQVAAVGSSVQRFRVGDRVIGHVVTNWIDGEGPPELHDKMLSAGLPGVLCEYIVLHEDAAVATPATLSDVEAATLPIAGLTAWSALVETAKMTPGQTVLIQGTGGVALFAMQFAAAFGLRPIITSSSDEKLARAGKLGAWNVVNYRRTPDWDRAAIEMTAGAGVDHVLELAGGDNVRKSVNALAVGGRLSLIGILADTESALPTAAVTRKRITIQGIAMGHRKAFERMTAAIDATAVKPVVDAVYPFEDAVRAFEHLANGPFGKVVISLAQAGSKGDQRDHRQD
jgi:NADPH:quinone reductase-like Zn-dependent oxidoreductase